ncbi:cyclase family protein [Eubacterium multiforme]|uniref:Kynurenine formamidase n=1 Tax=Eubacterium multiforme TaxID=83339 RepID=A0ABT9UUC6_9FIRM|nr:cyclase family protein [Eubacterium multiforme]MDQ0149931.1 kynurenine formamidase [Eubacterium multiforme]
MDIFDLTHFIEDKMTAYSEEEKAKITTLATIKEDGYNVLKIKLATHTGTHIDLPKHIFEDGIGLDEVNLEKFIGRAIIIDCRNVKVIDKEFLINYIKEIENVEYLILKTGWEKYWNKNEYFSEYPILSVEGANFLGNIESLCGIGVDCISIDEENNEELINHKILLSKGKIIIENLCSLNKINSKFKIILAPLKLKNVDGSPTRVYGIVE